VPTNTALVERPEAGKKNSEAIGLSKGGLSTKIHATVDALGNPTNFYVTAGQVHDVVGQGDRASK
jgi:hypothetical protein